MPALSAVRMQDLSKSLSLYAVLSAVLAVCAAPAPAAPPQKASIESLRDGQHDFDWEFGAWATNVRVLRNPLSDNAPNWAEYSGTSAVRPVVGGRFNLVELAVGGTTGNIEGASLRLYNPQTHAWSLNYANVRSGMLTAPVTGAFDGHGRGVFYGEDRLDGRPIQVRFIITTVSNSEARFEQAYSADDGLTWQDNWLAVDIRR